MKIIEVDNFGRDSISDVLVAENVSKHHARRIVKLLNEDSCSPNYPYFYKVVEDDYELYKFLP